MPIGAYDNVAFDYQLPQQEAGVASVAQQVIEIVPFSVGSLAASIGTAGFVNVIDVIMPYATYITEIDILPISSTTTTNTQYYVQYGRWNIGSVSSPVSALAINSFSFTPPFFPKIYQNEHITVFANASVAGSYLQLQVMGIQV